MEQGRAAGSCAGAQKLYPGLSPSDFAGLGGAFRKIANLLPFAHAVELERAVLRGAYAAIFPHLWWVAAYAAVVTAAAVFCFLRDRTGTA